MCGLCSCFGSDRVHYRAWKKDCVRASARRRSGRLPAWDRCSAKRCRLEPGLPNRDGRERLPPHWRLRARPISHRTSTRSLTSGQLSARPPACVATTVAHTTTSDVSSSQPTFLLEYQASRTVLASQESNQDQNHYTLALERTHHAKLPLRP